METVEVK